MVGGAVKVRPLFATPFGEVRLPNCERLNRELEALFLQRETEEHRNPTPSHVPQPETFESRFNLFRWTETCVQELRSFMLNAVAQMVIETTSLKAPGYRQAQLSKSHLVSYLTLRRILRRPQSPAGVVVRACTACAPVKALRSTRTAACCDSSMSGRAPMPIWIRRMRPCSVRMHSAPVELKLEAGQLVIFPSYVFHEVTPFYGSDTRITVATNCWFA